MLLPYCALYYSVQPGSVLRLCSGNAANKSDRRHFFKSTLGFVGIREYRASRGRRADIDSGPIVLQVGAAATGIGIAATKAVGDDAAFESIVRLAEIRCNCGINYSICRFYPLGLQMISRMRVSKNICVLLALSTIAVSAPRPRPPIAIASSPERIKPASVAIHAISQPTLTPWLNRRSTCAMTSSTWIAPNRLFTDRPNIPKAAL